MITACTSFFPFFSPACVTCTLNIYCKRTDVAEQTSLQSHAQSNSDAPSWMVDYDELKMENLLGHGAFGDVWTAQFRGQTVPPHHNCHITPHKNTKQKNRQNKHSSDVN